VVRCATKVSTKPNYPLIFLPKTNSSQTPAITVLFLKTYFFKLASNVSGGELVKLDYMKSFPSAYGERMTEAQERQLERRLTELCQRYRNRFRISRVFLRRSRRSSSQIASGSRYTIPLFSKRIRHLS